MKRYLDINRRIADYIYDDMNPEDMVMLEQEMQSDPELSELYQLNRQVRDYLQAKVQLEEMRSDPQLEEAEKLAAMAFEPESAEEKEQITLPAGQRNKKRNLRYAAVIAATVAIILSVGIRSVGSDPDRLFDQYYKPLEASDFSQRGPVNELYGDLTMGINHYLEGNYSQTIDQFRELASDRALQSEVDFFEALAYLGLGEYQAAQNSLEKNLLDAEIRYQAETLWYLSLCYLKTGAYDRANTLLGELEMYEGMYKQDAHTLRKKLRRLR